uniref:Uncharacterized protein n=1 Tax=Lactuca sativa TaxID=4236 RepID=A0A9R1WE93_LACSA|nr:hypothetical protein LSAT_V11C200095170 [Lactuca sativa]
MEHKRVTALDLNSQGLQGSLYPYVGNLNFLRGFSLCNNTFQGTIPQELRRLSRLPDWSFCILVLVLSLSTPIDPSLKLLPNKGSPVSQLKYSRAIGCLMYVMISTRLDIAYAMGRLSRYTSIKSHLDWRFGRYFLPLVNSDWPGFVGGVTGGEINRLNDDGSVIKCHSSSTSLIQP